MFLRLQILVFVVLNVSEVLLEVFPKTLLEQQAIGKTASQRAQIRKALGTAAAMGRDEISNKRLNSAGP